MHTLNEARIAVGMPTMIGGDKLFTDMGTLIIGPFGAANTIDDHNAHVPIALSHNDWTLEYIEKLGEGKDRPEHEIPGTIKIVFQHTDESWSALLDNKPVALGHKPIPFHGTEAWVEKLNVTDKSVDLRIDRKLFADALAHGEGFEVLPEDDVNIDNELRQGQDWGFFDRPVGGRI